MKTLKGGDATVKVKTIIRLFLIVIFFFIPLIGSLCGTEHPAYAGSLMMIGAGTPAASSQSFSVLQSKTTTGYGSYTTIQPTSSVTAGSLIVIWATWGAQSGTPTISDGTTSLTAGTQNHTTGSFYGQFFYLLSSVASGSLTYTFTLAGSPTYVNMKFYEVSHSSATTLDAQNTATDYGTAAVSGTISTANAVSIVFGGLDDYGASPPFTSPTIGGTAMTATLADSWSNGSGYRILSSTMTNGAASFTVSSSSQWVSSIIAFK